MALRRLLRRRDGCRSAISEHTHPDANSDADADAPPTTDCAMEKRARMGAQREPRKRTSAYELLADKLVPVRGRRRVESATAAAAAASVAFHSGGFLRGFELHTVWAHWAIMRTQRTAQAAPTARKYHSPAGPALEASPGTGASWTTVTTTPRR